MKISLPNCKYFMQFCSLSAPPRKGCLHEKEELERQLQGMYVTSEFSIFKI